MRAGCLDLPLQPEALTDHIGELRQNFGEVAAGLLLQEHGRGKEAHVQQRDAIREIGERYLQSRAQVLLVK